MKKNILLICLCFVLTCFANAIFVGNEGDCAYRQGCPKGITSYDSSNQDIKDYILKSSVAFLDSECRFIQVLLMLEANQNGYDLKLNEAITSLENAVSSYSDLVKITAATPYNDSFINKLKTFDYQLFMTQHSMITELFKKVESTLKVGNVNHVWETALLNTKQLLNNLYAIKTAIDTQAYPQNDLLFETNQLYMQTHLYLQYASQVFTAIK